MEKKQTYTLVIEPVSEGGFWGFVPQLPGCVSQGETIDETMKNIQEAIRLYIDVLREDGEIVPEESDQRIFARAEV